MDVFLCLVVICSYIIFYWKYGHGGSLTKNGIKLPPGPPGIPILGNIHQIGSKGPLKFFEWAQQYGKMYTVDLGNNTPALVVNDVALMKQIFGTMASTGKLWNHWFNLVFGGAYGILNCDGKAWQEQRNFLIKTFKDFGFGSKVSSHIECMMLTEINELSRHIAREMETKGAVHLPEFLKESAGGTLWALVTGKRITPEMVQLVEQFIKVTNKAQNSGLMFFSGLKYIAPNWSGYTEGKEVAKNMHALVENTFEEHKRADHVGGNRDIITAFLEQTKKMEGSPNSVFYGPVGEYHNIKTVVTLLVAGVESTSTTLNWLLFYLCVFPEVQKKLQKEIDEVLENGRDPNLSDKARMIYTEAVILEGLRLSSVVPLGLVHQLTDPITIQGQTFPKGLCLMPNTFYVHHDEEIWGDPNEFRPERFLEEFVDDGGNRSLRIIQSLRDSVVSFQPGRRTCAGESLARDVIFMFLVKLCQNFNYLPVEGKTKEEYMEPQFGLLILPTNLGIRAERRN